MIESPANLGTPKKRRHRHLPAMIKPNPYSLHGPPPMNWPASHRFWSSFIAVELAIEPGPRSGLIRKKRMAVLGSARPGRGQASQRGWLSCLLCCLRRAPRQGSPSVSARLARLQPYKKLKTSTPSPPLIPPHRTSHSRDRTNF